MGGVGATSNAAFFVVALTDHPFFHFSHSSIHLLEDVGRGGDGWGPKQEYISYSLENGKNGLLCHFNVNILQFEVYFL